MNQVGRLSNQKIDCVLVFQIDGSTEDATSSSGNCQDDEGADSDVESCDDAFVHVEDDFADDECELPVLLSLFPGKTVTTRNGTVSLSTSKVSQTRVVTSIHTIRRTARFTVW